MRSCSANFKSWAYSLRNSDVTWERNCFTLKRAVVFKTRDWLKRSYHWILGVGKECEGSEGE